MVALNQMIEITPLPVGRRILALAKVEKIATDLGLTEIAEMARDLQGKDADLVNLEATWAKTPKKVRGRGDLKALDKRLDRTLIGLAERIRSAAKGLDADDPLWRLAAEIYELAFPSGLARMIRLPYAKESSEAERVVRLFDSPERQQTVKDLELATPLERLKAASADFKAALLKNPELPLVFKDVLALRDTNHDLMLQLVVVILNKFREATPENLEARTALLSPILTEAEAEREYRAARSSGTEEDDEEGGEAPNTTPNPPAE